MLEIHVKKTSFFEDKIKKNKQSLQVAKTIEFGGASYILYCAIFHHGSESSKGHYFAMLRDEASEQWYECNDDNVKPGNLPKKSSSVCFLAFVKSPSQLKDPGGTIESIFANALQPADNRDAVNEAGILEDGGRNVYTSVFKKYLKWDGGNGDADDKMEHKDQDKEENEKAPNAKSGSANDEEEEEEAAKSRADENAADSGGAGGDGGGGGVRNIVNDGETKDEVEDKESKSTSAAEKSDGNGGNGDEEDKMEHKDQDEEENEKAPNAKSGSANDEEEEEEAAESRADENADKMEEEVAAAPAAAEATGTSDPDKEQEEEGKEKAFSESAEECKRAKNAQRCKFYRTNLSKEAKAAIKATDRARKAKRKAELKNSNPEEHRREMDEANHRKRLNRVYNKLSKAHNLAYPSDNVPDKQHDKPTYKVGGTFQRNQIYVPPRITNLRQHLHDILDASGKDNEGHFAEVTESSLIHMELGVFCLLSRDVRCRKLFTLDIGPGMLMPSLVFSQYLFEHGFHVGIDSQQNRVTLLKQILRNYSLKGKANIRNGLFKDKTKGEITNVLPPRVDCVPGDIVSVCVFVCLCQCY